MTIEWLNSDSGGGTGDINKWLLKIVKGCCKWVIFCKMFYKILWVKIIFINKLNLIIDYKISYTY